MARSLVILLLCILMAGFGLCSLSSAWAALSFGGGPILLLVLFNAGMAWLCWLGVRRLRAPATGAAAPEPPAPPPA